MEYESKAFGGVKFSNFSILTCTEKSWQSQTGFERALLKDSLMNLVSAGKIYKLWHFYRQASI